MDQQLNPALKGRSPVMSGPKKHLNDARGKTILRAGSTRSHPDVLRSRHPRPATDPAQTRRPETRPACCAVPSRPGPCPGGRSIKAHRPRQRAAGSAGSLVKHVLRLSWDRFVEHLVGLDKQWVVCPIPIDGCQGEFRGCRSHSGLVMWLRAWLIWAFNSAPSSRARLVKYKKSSAATGADSDP